MVSTYKLGDAIIEEQRRVGSGYVPPLDPLPTHGLAGQITLESVEYHEWG